jgi:uncharacterized membrane protein YhaH (DUF805 family)
MNWYLEVLQKYAVFDGRACRTEYWTYALFSALISLVLTFVEGLVDELPPLVGAYSLAVFLPSIAVTVRRLHDTDRSGWWLLIAFVPCIGAIALLLMMVCDSDSGRNRYGVNPKPKDPKPRASKPKDQKPKIPKSKKTPKRKNRK